MARKHCRSSASEQARLAPCQISCWECGERMWVSYHSHRTITFLDRSVLFTLSVRSCHNPACPAYKKPYRPEQEGALALPQCEFGLDVVCLVGLSRYRDHQSMDEIHKGLHDRGVAICPRTVTNLLYRYEELMALRLADNARLQEALKQQTHVILAIDGLQPDVGHEVLWVIRDCLSGEILLARSLLGSTQDDLAPLLREVQQGLPVPIHSVVSDGQTSLRRAVELALPGVPHQLCQFHYLREAARPIYEADRHAKKELKKQVRGVRSIEKGLEARSDPLAEAALDYCAAIRSAITDDGRPPLCASGLKLQQRLTDICGSLERVAEKGGPFQN